MRSAWESTSADLRFIVHYDVPGSLEAYLSRSGARRADGQPATCLLLFNFADTFTQEFFIEGSCPPLDLIHEVYQTICRFRTDDIEVTVRELAELAAHKKANEMAVSSSLKLLEKAGYIERGTEGHHQGRITLLEPPDKLRERCSGSEGPSAQHPRLLSGGAAWQARRVAQCRFGGHGRRS